MYIRQCPSLVPLLRLAFLLTHTQKYAHTHTHPHILSSEGTVELGFHFDKYGLGALKQKLSS